MTAVDLDSTGAYTENRMSAGSERIAPPRPDRADQPSRTDGSGPNGLAGSLAGLCADQGIDDLALWPWRAA